MIERASGHSICHPQFTGKRPPTNQHSRYVVDKFVLTSCCNRVTWLVPSGRSYAKLRGHAMLRCMASRLRRTVAILTLARHPIESYVTREGHSGQSRGLSKACASMQAHRAGGKIGRGETGTSGHCQSVDEACVGG